MKFRRQKIHFYFIKIVFRRRNFTFRRRKFFLPAKIKFRRADGMGISKLTKFCTAKQWCNSTYVRDARAHAQFRLNAGICQYNGQIEIQKQQVPFQYMLVQPRNKHKNTHATYQESSRSRSSILNCQQKPIKKQQVPFQYKSKRSGQGKKVVGPVPVQKKQQVPFQYSKPVGPVPV